MYGKTLDFTYSEKDILIEALEQLEDETSELVRLIYKQILDSKDYTEEEYLESKKAFNAYHGKLQKIKKIKGELKDEG